MITSTKQKINLNKQWGHTFSTYAKFSKKLTFLPPDTHTYVCVSGGKEMLVFGKLCIRTKWMIPILNSTC